MKSVVRISRIPLVPVVFIVIASAFAFAQDSKPAPSRPADPSAASRSPETSRAYSGMYSFLEDGEFVQITVEDDGKVTGYVSRYGEGGSEKGTFLEHYFRSGQLSGNRLSFTTEDIQGISFDFKGTVERGDGKNPGDEAYYVLKGALTENSTDAAKKVASHSREVVLKMFPQGARD